MLLVFGIAVAAACAVAAYGWLSNRDSEAAERSARAVRQLVTVVAVLARAVDGVLDALQPPPAPDRVSATRLSRWDDLGAEERDDFDEA